MTPSNPLAHRPNTALVSASPVDLTTDDLLDDDPMPIPSTWSSTALVRREPARFQELGWGIVGFSLGLCIVVPAVLVATGDIGPWLRERSGSPEVALAQPANDDAARQFAAATAVPLSLAFAGQNQSEDRAGERYLSLPEPETAIRDIVVTPVAAATAAATQRTKTNPEIVVMEARGLIAGGEIAEARALLEEARSTASGEVLFLLGETYDPVRLEAWGVRDVAADADKARGIYMLSMLAGVSKAGDRIRELQGR